MNKSLLPTSLALLSLSALSLTLGACASLTHTAATEQKGAVTTPADFCAAVPAVTFDRLNDTLATIASAKVANARRDAICNKVDGADKR